MSDSGKNEANDKGDKKEEEKKKPEETVPEETVPAEFTRQHWASRNIPEERTVNWTCSVCGNHFYSDEEYWDHANSHGG
jgi:hypothetical protein